MLLYMHLCFAEYNAKDKIFQRTEDVDKVKGMKERRRKMCVVYMYAISSQEDTQCPYGSAAQYCPGSLFSPLGICKA